MIPPIRIGIGGWTYEPWRGTFYPEKLPAKRELEHASRAVTASEVNGTFSSSFKPATFANWRDTAPDGFVLALKASRYCVSRKALGEAAESVQRFVGQGIVELGDKLGPIMWQLPATKKFDAGEIAAFLALLPKAQDGVALRHAIQVRHATFAVPEFVALCRAAGVAIVHGDSAVYPALADVSGDLVYARLENAREEEPTGYDAGELDRWADVARSWAVGESPAGLPYVADPAPVRPRDVFVFFINGAKVRAPHGAMALIERMGR